MNITDDFPVGTRIVLEVVESKDCSQCFLSLENGFDCIPTCLSTFRNDNTGVCYKLVEVKEP